MANKYSKYLSENKHLLEELVSILSKDYKFVSVLGSDCNGKQISVMPRQTTIADNSFNERGFVVRIHNGNNYAEYSFNEINEELIPEIVKKIKDQLLINETFKSTKNIELKEYQLLVEEELTQDFERDSNKVELTDKEVAEKLTKIVENGMKHENVVNFVSRFVKMDVSKVYISNKKNLTQFYTWTNVMILPIVADENGNNSFYEAISGVNSVKLLNDIEGKIDEACATAKSLLTSTPIEEPGEYEIITAPDITGLIAHEAFGHGVEMDMFVKGRAKAVEYIDKRVASDIVTMHEAAKGNEECSSYFFDDEGTLAHDTVEIKDGILKGGVCDAISALVLGYHPTGNGKRQSFERKAYTRMTSTYFEGGNDTLEDMIKSIKHGYLITGMHSGMEDPKNWGIQCAAALGREIVDGKFTGKVVSPVMMTGYVPDLLCSISMRTSEVELFGSGMCGKGYKEWVKTADGGPYLKAKVNLG